MLPIEEDSHRQECSRHDDKSHFKAEAGEGDLIGSIPIFIFFVKDTYFHYFHET